MFENLKNKNILLGITGGIAAYKSAELVRLFCKAGSNVKVIMTTSAKEFITPLTMQTLSGNVVYDDMFCKAPRTALDHIELSRWADVIVVAPATANFIAHLTYGFADNLLTAVCLACSSPIAVAPAMNKNMWTSDITQKNIGELKLRNIYILGPTSGMQACGDIGEGRMLEAKDICFLTAKIFANNNILVGKKVLLTAGPTHEPIDPVRYISNKSSGKMGYALADAACAAGAEVYLISGPTNLEPHPKAKILKVKTAHEMHAQVMSIITKISPDIFIAAAAVADYEVANKSELKIKKTTNDSLNNLTLQLIPNPDILATVASLPIPKRPFFCVGFAAETENLLTSAKRKLINKNVDMILANKVGENEGFEVDDNELTILQKDEDPIFLERASKKALAMQIIKIVADKVSN